MAKKRGRPKKLPSLPVKDFDRQFREARIPAFLVDRELTVVYVNDYACAAFPGVDRPEGLRVLLPEDVWEECVRRVAEKECFRLPLPSVGGSAAIAVTPVAEEGEERAAGAMLLVTCSDQPMEQAMDDDSVVALSKSLRQPLSNIFASLAVISRKARLADWEGQYDPYLHTINLASYQLLRNINNLVSYQRSCFGRREPIEVVDFWACLAPLLDACDIALHNNEIPFRFQIPEKESVAHVSCCFGEIEDALMNLISNAYCHSRPGNRVMVTGKNIKNAVVVTVSDCGRGIESDQLDKIFTPFYSYGTDKDAHVGMGIGLTVARQNILRSGGTLAIDSTPGEGTSIAFTLPTCDAPLSPPLIMASGAAEYLRDPFSKLYIGLCDFASLPHQ